MERHSGEFLDSDPYKVGIKRDPTSRKLIYYVTNAVPTPDCLPLIAGDIIQNLMSSLDHLAFQLVCCDTNDAPPNQDWIYFPIRNSPEEYEAAKRGKMKGASDDTFAAIDALKPYKGGLHLLWVLYRLNVIDKHRLLLTVGSQVRSIDIGRDLARRFGSTPQHVRETLSGLELYIAPKDHGFPLKGGFELFIGSADDEPDSEQQFRFEIALNEPGILEGAPLVETLHQLTTAVTNVVMALSSLLR